MVYGKSSVCAGLQFRVSWLLDELWRSQRSGQLLKIGLSLCLCFSLQFHLRSSSDRFTELDFTEQSVFERVHLESGLMDDGVLLAVVCGHQLVFYAAALLMRHLGRESQSFRLDVNGTDRLTELVDCRASVFAFISRADPGNEERHFAASRFVLHLIFSTL